MPLIGGDHATTSESDTLYIRHANDAYTSATCSQRYIFSLSAEHFLLILLTCWINRFLKLLIVETTSKRFTQYVSNIQTIVYCFMLKNLLNSLAVKRYFMYDFYKNYCYLRLRKTYIQQPRTLCVFLARAFAQWQYFGELDCRSERVNRRNKCTGTLRLYLESISK